MAKKLMGLEQPFGKQVKAKGPRDVHTQRSEKLTI